MSKTIIIIIGIFLIIFVLITVSSWQFKKLGETLREKGEIPEFGKIEFREFENLIRNLQGYLPGKTESKEFISPDGKLKFTYLSDWIEIKELGVLERILPKERLEKYGVDILFFAQKIKPGTFTQLEVNRMNLETGEKLEGVIEKMKEDNKQNGGEMEIIKSEIKNNEGVFEAGYKKAGREDIHSKEKMLLYEIDGEKKVYLVSVIAFEKNWQEFEKEASGIINSAQIIE